MSLRDHNQAQPCAQTQQDRRHQPVIGGQGENAGSVTQMVHELANLLDGSLRHVELVLSSVKRPISVPRQRGDEDAHVWDHLHVARDAMRQMATLMQRWMVQRRPSASVFDQPQTFGQAVRQAVDLCVPEASKYQIDIRVQLSDDAAQLPAGPVYTIIINALRNSIQAMAGVVGHGSVGLRHRGKIELSVRVSGGAVDLSIRDHGPGLDPSIVDEQGRVRFGVTTKPDGCGMGLLLCADIAASLGGHIQLNNRLPTGVVFALTYPLKKALCQ